MSDQAAQRLDTTLWLDRLAFPCPSPQLVQHPQPTPGTGVT